LGDHLPPTGSRIGVLGGSFNPAHEAHLEISKSALRRLGLDEVWWLVSPQNPLKSPAEMAPQDKRIARARALTRHSRIRVTDLESLLGTRYTADSLAALRRIFPRVRFVWLMGADNLVQIAEWRDWPQIFNTLVIAVFDRPSYSLRATVAKAARRFAAARISERAGQGLARRKPPAWCFIHGRRNPQSGTRIRRAGKAVAVGNEDGAGKP